MCTYLEQIKNDKVKEAEELFTTLGIKYNQEQLTDKNTDEFFAKQSFTIKEEPVKEHRLIWTRLSINSNNSFIIK